MAKPYNPLAPLTPKQLNRAARRYAQAQFGPVLSQINAEYARRSRAGASAISSSTQQLANELSGQAAQTHAIYGQAQSAQSAIDNAIAAKLTGAGQAAQADVGGQLAAAGQAPSPTNLAQIGAGAGAASFGMGSAALSRLVAEGAARENYSAALPGIARLGGAQRGQDLALQLEHGRQTDVGNLRSKIPGTVANIEQQLNAQEFQKALAGQSGLINQQKLNLDTAYKSAKIRQGAQKLRIDAAKTRTDNYFKQAGLDLKGKQYDLSVQREHRLAAGKKGKKGGYTPTQIQKLRSNSIEAVKVLKHGQPNPNYDKNSPDYHNGIPDTQQYSQKPGSHDARSAFKYLINHGVPPTMADWAVGRVYGPWMKPGEKRRRLGKGGRGRGPGGAGPR